jgi:hypothetical protein
MALAVALAMAGVNLARVGINRVFLGINTLEWKLLKPLGAAIPAALGLWGLLTLLKLSPLFQLLLGLPLLLGVYFGTLLLLGLEEEDRAQLERILARLKVG